jgi:hypothetical protein
MGLYRTDWALESSEEKSGSLLASVAFGALYFKNVKSGESMKVKYRAVGVGLGKGPPAGANWSNASDPSGGFDNVGVVPGRSFGSLSFPCRGYMLGIGGSAGVVGSILGMDVTGGGLTVALFGMVPVFAGIRLWGFGRGALPGLGMNAQLALFQLESVTGP